MALYIFIATPLSFWHHCDELENETHVAKIEKTSQKDPKIVLDKEAKKCLICGFEYSPIINNVVFTSLPNVYSYPALFTQKIISKESAFNALHTNKGPPSLFV
ncbi:hypothetical protein [Pedobacter sp. Hv1]|uniref:hypothetical protein n=1 Tax=Pedobacter sp. Hv1 TaxID=1740090 RepID=UPI0006D8BD61|nr:hypothetical protein [Pedobacter sp. Hv1]KQC02240.1 hypothetical protein AQF98_01300 [Pedobacter sp. Hv1]